MADQITYADAPERTAQTPAEAGSASSFIWYELLTPDPAAAKAFYDAVVGWSIDPDTVASGLEYRIIKSSDGGQAGGAMTLSEEMQSHGARPVWLGYLQVVDVDAAVDAIKRDGGQVMMPPWDQPGVGRLAMVTDAQGAPFYLMTPLPPEGGTDQASGAFSVDRPQHVRWNELSTSDPDAAVAFYTGHFGWVQDGDMDMGEMGKYRFVHANGVAIGAVMPKPPQMPVSSWTYYIGVDDIDRAAEAITAGGGSLLYEPMEVPGGEYALGALDPHHAMFGLVGPRHS